jgi:hypothetical protein
VVDRESSDWRAVGQQFDVDEPTLTYLRVNFQTRLQFGRTEVVIESPFRLTVGDAVYDLDPNDRSGLGPLLALYPDTLDRLTMSARGTLTLSFVSGASVTVEPDEHYEAWSVGDFICPPGGFNA